MAGLAPQLHVRLLCYGERLAVMGFRLGKAEVVGEISEGTPAFMVARPREGHRAAGRGHVHARSTKPGTSSPRSPPARPVRGRPWEADGFTHRSGGTSPSAMRPWTPQHNGPQHGPSLVYGPPREIWRPLLAEYDYATSAPCRV